jgi:MoeA N-terminal region (domain I and II)
VELRQHDPIIDVGERYDTHGASCAEPRCEPVSTPNIAIGASELVDGAHSASERHREARQLFAPAHALQIILDGVEALPGEEKVAIRDIAGRVTVEDICSPLSLPRFDNSAMDGYGLHIDDLQTDGSARLPIVDRIQAGGSMAISLSRGSAVRITTGAQVPQGVAAVVPDEHVDVQDLMLRVRRFPREGANIRPRGEDVGRGELLAPAGTLIDARHKALMAATGVREVSARRHISVGHCPQETNSLSRVSPSPWVKLSTSTVCFCGRF